MPSASEVSGVQMNWPPVALVVRVWMTLRLVDGPDSSIMVTGLTVSFVEYVIAVALPSVIGFGTVSKVNTVL